MLCTAARRQANANERDNNMLCHSHDHSRSIAENSRWILFTLNSQCNCINSVYWLLVLTRFMSIIVWWFLFYFGQPHSMGSFIRLGNSRRWTFSEIIFKQFSPLFFSKFYLASARDCSSKRNAWRLVCRICPFEVNIFEEFPSRRWSH